MRFIVSKTLLVSLCIFLIIPVNNSFAVSKKEWQDLNLFYGKDDLVVTSTRHPKHISHVPENIEVVTSEEIEKMNVHTVAEVLSRVNGVFVNKKGSDFGSNAVIKIQGVSAQAHVRVMVDGVPFNNVSEGFPSTINFPVGIVERIEIIKGPASSAWGSSLGGVINIITKDPVKEKLISGKIQTSYGKENSQDHRLELSGTEGDFGYYLYGNIQDSDGLVDTRYYKNQNYFSKLKISPSKYFELTLSSGYSQPELNAGYNSGATEKTIQKLPKHWVLGSMISNFNDSISFDINLSYVKIKGISEYRNVTTDALNDTNEYEEDIFSITGQVSYNYNDHTLVIGYDGAKSAEYDYYSSYASNFYDEVDKDAYYLNNTFNFGDLTIVPGFRYDRYNYLKYADKSFTSPSFGAVYRINSDSTIRATVAKGFNAPPLGWLKSEPNLENEEVISYQAGFETRTIPYLWLKTSIFYNCLENKIAEGGTLENLGDIKRYGSEIEVRTLKIKKCMFTTGASFVRSKYDYISSRSKDPTNKYTLNIGLTYEDKEPYKNSNFFRCSITGYFIYWDIDNNEEYDDFIWDFNLNKNINFNGYSMEFFLVVHNIFDGNQYINGEINENPTSWLESGLKFKF
ncbi:MAG: TonB-dependent receptor [Desulfobacterales bacterium]|nr:TonB-dependent receptor [Desulfobacterales bacterium]